MNRPVITTLSALLFLAACSKPTKKDGPGPASSESPAASSAVTAQSQKKRELPWYAGSWSGTYAARHHRVQGEAKEGAVREWSEDDGGTITGNGRVSLQIDEAGDVRGSAEGALGTLLATGEADETTLRVNLVPQDPGLASSAFLFARRENTAFKGQINASTGDSLSVRQASIELVRVQGAAKPAIDGGP